MLLSCGEVPVNDSEKESEWLGSCLGVLRARLVWGVRAEVVLENDGN